MTAPDDTITSFIQSARKLSQKEARSLDKQITISQ